MDMVIDRKLVLKEKSGETIVYPAQYYYLELNTARMLNELNIVCPEDKELVRHRIELIEKETGTVLDEMQKKAITEAADHGLFIHDGGDRIRGEDDPQTSGAEWNAGGREGRAFS